MHGHGALGTGAAQFLGLIERRVELRTGDASESEPWEEFAGRRSQEKDVFDPALTGHLEGGSGQPLPQSRSALHVGYSNRSQQSSRAIDLDSRTPEELTPIPRDQSRTDMRFNAGLR